MIVKHLKIQEIKKLYDGKKVNKNLCSQITLGYDYVVISIETVIEYKKNNKRLIRYWIVNDKECLIPYDAYNFKIIDSYFSESWVINLDKKGIQISQPKWSQYGYVENYFDNIKVEKEYNKIVKKIFDESVEAALQKGVQLNLGIKKLWIERLSD